MLKEIIEAGDKKAITVRHDYIGGLDKGYISINWTDILVCHNLGTNDSERVDRFKLLCQVVDSHSKFDLLEFLIQFAKDHDMMDYFLNHTSKEALFLLYRGTYYWSGSPPTTEC